MSAPKQIYIGGFTRFDRVEIILDAEGAEYIAEVMEQYQPKDAGAKQIVTAIRKELGR